MDNQIRRQTEKHSAKQSLGVLIASANGLAAARAPLDQVNEGRRRINPPRPDEILMDEKLPDFSLTSRNVLAVKGLSICSVAD